MRKKQTRINLSFNMKDERHVTIYNLIQSQEKKTDFVVEELMKRFSQAATKQDLWELGSEIREMIENIQVTVEEKPVEEESVDDEIQWDLMG